MTIAGVCAALIGMTSFLPLLPTPSGTTFIETRLCATGRTIRLELPGQREPADEAPMPCHAVCARDDDDPASDKKRHPKG